MDRQRLLDRFLKYVRINTMADEAADAYPSSEGQWELGRLLLDELRDAGLTDAKQTDKGLILATIPATVARRTPVVALNAHLDTSPETSGEGVNPQVIERYAGGDITLPKDRQKVIRVHDNPELTELRGKTLITTDGTTLLGADDKAGLAIIMELVDTLTADPSIPHGPIRVLFTCDEEIGRGVDHVDFAELAADICYTLDGPGGGQIDVETFSADLAKVTIRGVNIHPSIGKDRMVNAIKAAATFVDLLPRERLSPETSSGREGFLHPYSIRGGVAQVDLNVLLRDFDTPNLAQHAKYLQSAAETTRARHPGVQVEINVLKQYRNLGDGLRQVPHAVEFAEQAYRRIGATPRRSIIRGGTDGSMFTERGLPTPNLSSGQHNPHSCLEWACLDEMVQAVEMLVQLVQVWADRGEK